MRIVYKGDLGLIPSFKDAGLGPFELYVRDSKDLDETLEDFCAIHFVHKIDDGRAIDLGDTGEVGDVSAELLKKAVECAKRNQVGKIVVHPPAINIWEQERKEVISSFAQKLEYAYDSDVEICIENLALWIHTAYTSEPLFYDPADFLDILEGTKERSNGTIV
jgi:sugar phosphate isomerase/epimerase